MSPCIDHLVAYVPTAEQQAILAFGADGNARILAGPGTGKSATVVALVGRLIDEDEDRRVRLLTFTRAATGELAKKVVEHPAVAANRPSTIHSFSIATLIRNSDVAGFPRPLRIADEWEDAEIVRPTLARRTALNVTQVGYLFIELAANWESLNPEEHPKVTPGQRARFLGAWSEHRDVYGYTLLAELPYLLRRALQDHDDLAGIDYDLLVVDEYQDLNACDLEVLHRLVDNGSYLVAVGDDDQSIYSFRKAAPEGIRRFHDEYPDAEEFPLSISHRCGSSILDWATFVIDGDPERPPRPRLTSAPSAPDGEVALLSADDQNAQAELIAALVEALITIEEVAAEEILILHRSDRYGLFSGPIKEALSERSIAHSNPELATQMLAQPDNRRLLALGKLLANTSDSLAWATLLELETGVGSTFFDHVYTVAADRREQFGTTLLKMFDDELDGAPSSRRRVLPLMKRVLDWIEATELPDPSETDWGHWLVEQADGTVMPAPSEEFERILREVDDVVEYGVSLERYLGQLSPLAKDILLAQSGGVRFMTMASSKGLTVRATIIAAAEEGLIPRPTADLAEERRLLYVAMTRSQEFLYVTWARQRTDATAYSGAATSQRRNHTRFLIDGPVPPQRGRAFLEERWQI